MNNPDRLGNFAAHSLLRADIEASLAILEQVTRHIGMKSEDEFWDWVVEPGEEDKALAHIRELRPQLYPNRLIIAMADFKLNRKGRMISAASTKSKNGLRTGF